MTAECAAPDCTQLRTEGEPLCHDCLHVIDLQVARHIDTVFENGTGYILLPLADEASYG